MHFCCTVPKITILRHRIRKKGVDPQEDKVTAIREFSCPRTIKGLPRLREMINFYYRFIPGAAETLAPIHFLLSTHKHSRKNLEWNEMAPASFVAMKQQLVDTTMLAFSVLNALTQLVIDASDTAVSAVMRQMGSGVTQPVAFFAQNFTFAQKKWSTFDRELLAIFLAVKHYKILSRRAPLYYLHRP